MPWTLLLWLACSETPSTAPAEVPVELRPEAALAVHRDLQARVVSIGWERTTTGHRATLDLALENTTTPVWDGAAGRRRTVTLPRAGLRLVADGVAWPADPLPDQTGWFGEIIGLPPEASGRLRGRLSFHVDGETLPNSVELRIPWLSDTLLVPITGPLLDPTGQPGRAFAALGVGDVPVPAAVEAEIDGAWSTVSAPIAGAPWRIPERAARVRATLPEHAPWEGPLRADGLTLARLRPTAGWPAAIPAPPAEGEATVDRLAERLATPEEAAAWVREQVGVLAAHGMQRSPRAVLRAGAGSPIERAELLRAVVHRLGHRAAIVCGDLAPDQVGRVFTPPTAPAAPSGPLGDVVRTVDELVAAWAAPIGEALDPAALPTSAHDRFQLVPEWCWVQLVRDEGNVDLDLRPDALRATPLPRVWRSATRPGEHVWRVELRLIAVTRADAPGGAPAWDTQELLVRETDAPTLSERPLLLDLWPDGEGRLRATFTALDTRDVAGAEGKSVDPALLDHLILDVTWRDPYEAASFRRELSLWDTLPDNAPPAAVRALITTDTGARDLDVALRRADEVTSARYLAPGARALQLEHDLYAMMMHHAAEGQPGWAPPVRVTLLTAEADGVVTRRFDEAGAPAPAGLDAHDPLERERMGVAVHAVSQILQGLGHTMPPLTPPRVRWATTGEGFSTLPFPGPQAQIRARRHLGDGASGVDEAGMAWWADAHTGGLAPLPPATPTPLRIVVAPGPPSAIHEAWELVSVCGALRRLGALTGVHQLPGSCLPAP